MIFAAQRPPREGLHEPGDGNLVLMWFPAPSASCSDASLRLPRLLCSFLFLGSEHFLGGFEVNDSPERLAGAALLCPISVGEAVLASASPSSRWDIFVWENKRLVFCGITESQKVQVGWDCEDYPVRTPWDGPTKACSDISYLNVSSEGNPGRDPREGGMRGAGGTGLPLHGDFWATLSLICWFFSVAGGEMRGSPACSPAPRTLIYDQKGKSKAE